MSSWFLHLSHTCNVYLCASSTVSVAYSKFCSLVSVLQLLHNSHKNTEHIRVAQNLLCAFWWRFQAQCSTKDIPKSLVSEVKAPTIGGPDQGGYSERKDETDVLKSGKGLMQSRLTSLYTNGHQKAVETAHYVEGRMTISFGAYELIPFFILQLSV